VSAPPSARGIVRLLNTSGGGVLVLAGEIDAAAVEDFRRRYGREPARVDRIDAGSVTGLSEPALGLVREHLDAASGSSRPVQVCCSPLVGQLLADRAVQT
jgi:hypothetical protein